MLESSSSEESSDDLRQAIITIAGPRGWFDTRQSWLANAANKAGISYRMARSLFYRAAPNPGSKVVDKVRAAAALARKPKAEGRDEKQEAKDRDEFAKLHARISRLEEAMAISDEKFFKSQLDALRKTVPRRG